MTVPSAEYFHNLPNLEQNRRLRIAIGRMPKSRYVTGVGFEHDPRKEGPNGLHDFALVALASAGVYEGRFGDSPVVNRLVSAVEWGAITPIEATYWENTISELAQDYEGSIRIRFGLPSEPMPAYTGAPDYRGELGVEDAFEATYGLSDGPAYEPPAPMPAPEIVGASLDAAASPASMPAIAKGGFAVLALVTAAVLVVVLRK